MLVSSGDNKEEACEREVKQLGQLLSRDYESSIASTHIPDKYSIVIDHCDAADFCVLENMEGLTQGFLLVDAEDSLGRGETKLFERLLGDRSKSREVLGKHVEETALSHNVRQA